MSHEPLWKEAHATLRSHTMKQAFLAAAMIKATPAAQDPCPESDSAHQEFTVQWEHKC